MLQRNDKEAITLPKEEKKSPIPKIIHGQHPLPFGIFSIKKMQSGLPAFPYLNFFFFYLSVMFPLRFVLIILTALLLNTAWGQNRPEIVREAKIKLSAATSDSARVFYLNKIAWNISYSDLDSGLYYGNLALDLALASGAKEQLGMVYTTLATIQQDKGNLSIAAELYDKAIKSHNAINDESGLATTMSNYANLEATRGNRKRARELLFTSLDFFNKKNDKRSIALASSNMGTQYLEDNLIDSAEYFLEIGNRYCEELKLSEYMASNKAMLARVHSKQGKKAQAIEEIEFALDLLNIRKSPYDLVQVEQLYGDILVEFNDLSKAEKYYLSALQKAEKIGMRDHLMKIRFSLSSIYEKMGLHEKSLFEFKKYAELKTELNEASTLEKLNHMSYRLENERKSKEIELLKQQAKIRDLDQERQQQQIRVQNLIIVGGSVLFILVIVMVVYLVRSNKQKQKTNALLSHQKLEIEHKNKEITDSITYAKRIQEAILPPSKVIAQLIPKHFILYLPKDIVAGDFYWVASHKGKTYFAVCDCTGHGVPGAMVSVVCHNALQSVVHEMNISEPGKILDKVRELVTATFQTQQSEVRDGMDVSLCVYDPEKRVLDWSGANSPIMILRRNLPHEPEEVKAHKQSIGKTDDIKPFPTHRIPLEIGDRLYLFSDGYADQFGGTEGKKFKSSSFRKAIANLATTPIHDQGQLLLQWHNEWKGNYEQVDDICIMGIEI